MPHKSDCHLPPTRRPGLSWVVLKLARKRSRGSLSERRDAAYYGSALQAFALEPAKRTGTLRTIKHFDLRVREMLGNFRHHLQKSTVRYNSDELYVAMMVAHEAQMLDQRPETVPTGNEGASISRPVNCPRSVM